MNFVKHTNPTNLQQEKDRFFNDSSYNPQFTYSQPIPQDQLTKWGQPLPHVVQIAQQELEKCGYSLPKRQTIFSPRKFQTAIDQLISEIGISEPIKIQFIPDKVSRVSTRFENNQHTLLFKQEAKFANESEFTGMLNHELQTHVVRNLNQAKQGWEHNPDQYLELRKTEEGLAILHSYIHRPTEPIINPYFRYLTVSWAQQGSFRDVYSQLINKGIDSEKSWSATLRVKRGQTDTSQPGGMTKPIVYLEGCLQMWQWLVDPANNVVDLYSGKISTQELSSRLKTRTTTDYYLPTFFKDLAEYRDHIVEIGQTNRFNTIMKQL